MIGASAWALAMHCEIIASLLLLPPFLAASAVPAANARAATENAVTSRTDPILVLSIFLSCRYDGLDHERARHPTPSRDLQFAVVGWRAPDRGRPRGRVMRSASRCGRPSSCSSPAA